MAVDRDRTALYAAELAAFDGTDLERVVGLDAVIAAMRDVIESQWWPGPSVAIRGARADARSSSARCSAVGGGTTIAIAAGQATMATAAHELAHALAGAEVGHDASFRAAYLDVIAVLTNRSSVERRGDLHGEQLRDALSAAGLDVGNRRWPAPPEAVSGPIVL